MVMTVFFFGPIPEESPHTPHKPRPFYTKRASTATAQISKYSYIKCMFFLRSILRIIIIRPAPLPLQFSKFIYCCLRDSYTHPKPPQQPRAPHTPDHIYLFIWPFTSCALLCFETEGRAIFLALVRVYCLLLPVSVYPPVILRIILRVYNTSKYYIPCFFVNKIQNIGT